MSHLLGGRVCIDSLRQDVSDLQVCIIDIFSRVGPVKYRSWKYPDRVSCDLDINELLDTYNYSEDDEEDSQVAHIVLLELVIDRLILLIQSMSCYIEGVLSTDRAISTTSTNTSVGLVSRKFWNKLLKLYSSIQQIQSEKLHDKKRLSDVEYRIKQLQSETEVEPQRISSLSRTSVLVPLLTGSSHTLSTKSQSISRDCCHKSSQTYETAFLPCESCGIVQRCLRDVGERVIDTCRLHCLPSALFKFKPHICNDDWLTESEVREWVSEQNKDLLKISKHITQLDANAETLKADLTAANDKCREFQARINSVDRELKTEKETRSVVNKQHDSAMKKLREEYEDNISLEKRERIKIQSLKCELDSQLKRVSVELEKQTSTLKLVEETKQKLEHDLKEMQNENEQLGQLENKVLDLTRELGEKSIQLQNTTRELNQELAKNKSVAKHQQNVQNKQETLLRQIEEMDRENEELKTHACVAEEERDEKITKLRSVERELVETRNANARETEKIEMLNKEKAALLENIEEMKILVEELKKKVDETDDKERLLLDYPDLNGPIRPSSQGSGDVVNDMLMQIQANDIRINLLERQNVALRDTVNKMIQSNCENTTGTVKSNKPIQLWKHSDETVHEESSNLSHYKCDWVIHQGVVSTQPHELPKKNRPRTRTLSKNSSTPSAQYRCSSKQSLKNNVEYDAICGRMTHPSREASSGVSDGSIKNVEKTAISAYREIKKTQNQQNASEFVTTSVKRTHMKETRGPAATESLACPRCDKLYTSSKDLEIHSLYCYGKPHVFGLP